MREKGDDGQALQFDPAQAGENLSIDPQVWSPPFQLRPSGRSGLSRCSLNPGLHRLRNQLSPSRAPDLKGRPRPDLQGIRARGLTGAGVRSSSISWLVSHQRPGIGGSCCRLCADGIVRPHQRPPFCRRFGCSVVAAVRLERCHLEATGGL